MNRENMTAQETPTPTRTTVLHVGGLQWATSARGIEHTLTARPGVLQVDANALSQTATVIFDPTRTSLDELQGWIRECGYHCAGESVPTHVCAPADQLPTPTHHHDHGAHPSHPPLPGTPPEIHPAAEPDHGEHAGHAAPETSCLLYTSPSPRDRQKSRMPSSA